MPVPVKAAFPRSGNESFKGIIVAGGIRVPVYWKQYSLFTVLFLLVETIISSKSGLGFQGNKDFLEKYFFTRPEKTGRGLRKMGKKWFPLATKSLVH